MSFAFIKGQDTAVQMLKNSIQSRHISHAYIFSGPEGVGKRTTALAFAQGINCLQPSLNLDERCSCLSCRKSMGGNHPDIEIIRPEGLSIKIDQVRTLRNKVFYKCYESKFKVIIIDDAHLFTIEAANSLLKVLEEPPEKTIFILITAESQQLPDTIVSRCQQIQFHPLAVSCIIELLAESFPQHLERLPLVAGLARGSLTRAAGLLEDGQLLEKRTDTINLLKRVFETTPGEILLWCEKWDKDKQNIKIIFELIQFWYRDLLIWRTTSREDLLINQDYLVDIKNNKHTLSGIQKCLTLINQCRKHLDFNANPRLVLEVFLLRTTTN
ncbi:MAG: DNA polymerase III subunit delta' [Bacillota bacterium]